MTKIADTIGVHHVGLSVADLSQILRFFVETLGFEKVGEKPDYPAAFVSDGNNLITLWQVENPSSCQSFDRKNIIGLHHLALLVDGETKLDALFNKLEPTAEVDIEFAPMLLGAGPMKHMMCTIPGGIRMEFIAKTN